MMHKSTLLTKFVYFTVLFKIYECAYFSDVHWSTAIKLSEYESYRSVTLLSYHIPEQTAQVSFTFQAKTSGKSCSFKEVHIYLQHGSYPLLTPYNETYPENVYTNRTDAFHLRIEKDADAVSYMLSAPRPGKWYFAAFLPKSNYDKIRQKGLDKSCMYGMFVIVDSKGFDNIEEISTKKTHHVHLNQREPGSQALYRFVVPKDTVEYKVWIDGCLATKFDQGGDVSNSTDVNTTTTTAPPPKIVTCPVSMHVQSEMLPSRGAALSVSCGNLTHCEINTFSPTLHKWMYILLNIDNDYNVSDVQFKLHFDIKECESLKLLLPRTIYKATTTAQTSQAGLLPQDSCIKLASLGRFIFDQQTYNISYLLSKIGPIPIPASIEKVHVPDYSVIVTDLLIQEPTDIGGTLKLHVEFVESSLNVSSHSSVLYACLMKNAIPGGQTVVSCESGVHVILNTTSQHSHETVFLPYPEPGIWYLALYSSCFSHDTGAAMVCDSAVEVNLDISLSGCLDGQCGEYGACQDYISGVHVFSSCKCFAGWRGFGCTDGKFGRSKQEELRALLLLTLSNIFFVPAIILATYRRYFVEAAIYAYTMFFSAVYHACDASDLVYYCLLEYDFLSFADFLGSITSFWVTMLAMSEIPYKVRGFAQTMGAMGVAAAVEYDRHGVLAFAIPAGLAAIIMFGSWIFQCRRHRRLFPGKRYLLVHLLPGVILAITGMVLFAFLETKENYQYVHSCWHIAMSLSIVFLLPKRRQKEKIDEVNTENTSMESAENIDPMNCVNDTGTDTTFLSVNC